MAQISIKPTPAAIRALERCKSGELIRPEKPSVGSRGVVLPHLQPTLDLTPEYLTEILNFIRDGALLTELNDIPAFPGYDKLCDMRRDTDLLMPDGRTFGEHLSQALEDQAEQNIAAIKQAIEDAENSEDRDRSNMLRAKLQAYFWLAEKRNPKLYGKKTQLTDEEGKGPPTIVFKTAGE